MDFNEAREKIFARKYEQKNNLKFSQMTPDHIREAHEIKWKSLFFPNINIDSRAQARATKKIGLVKIS